MMKFVPPPSYSGLILDDGSGISRGGETAAGADGEGGDGDSSGDDGSS